MYRKHRSVSESLSLSICSTRTETKRGIQDIYSYFEDVAPFHLLTPEPEIAVLKFCEKDHSCISGKYHRYLCKVMLLWDLEIFCWLQRSGCSSDKELKVCLLTRCKSPLWGPAINRLYCWSILKYNYHTNLVGSHWRECLQHGLQKIYKYGWTGDVSNHD